METLSNAAKCPTKALGRIAAAASVFICGDTGVSLIIRSFSLRQNLAHAAKANKGVNA